MTETKKPLIIGIGELLWDMLPDGKVVGGAPVNFVYHATKQVVSLPVKDRLLMKDLLIFIGVYPFDLR